MFSINVHALQWSIHAHVYTYTNTHAHTRAHVKMHTHTYTYTQICGLTLDNTMEFYAVQYLAVIQSLAVSKLILYQI